MNWQAMFQTHGLGLYVLYFLTSLSLWMIFSYLYLRQTPYDEAADIAKGKQAPAISLGGAQLGFLVPLCTASYVTGTNWIAFVAWGVFAGAVQLVAYKIMFSFWGDAVVDEQNSHRDNLAVARVFATVALGLGLISAFAMIP